MERLKTEILFLLPIATEGSATNLVRQDAAPGNPFAFRGKTTARYVALKRVPSEVPNPYNSGDAERSAFADRSSSLRVLGTGATGGYDGDLVSRVWDYAARCAALVEDEPFDVIHAHDWVTFPAGMMIATQSSKPLIVQVHATEFDRSGEHPNPAVYEIERQGMEMAAGVIAVSGLTKSILVQRYGVPAHKVRVVYNGVIPKGRVPDSASKRSDEKIVLFLGRITLQKGPEYFVRAAKAVLEKVENVKFVVAGWGDMAPRIVEKVAAMGLGHKVFFTGFLVGEQVQQAFRMADVYVMPSVSEPFGLTALEAIQQGTPVILSKTSGVGEVIDRGALKVDFWDVNELANKIVAVLKRRELSDELRRRGRNEIRSLTWDAAARQCIRMYKEVLCLS
jgi:glycosyltransferase involved in cell wall biosynthesis